MQGILPSTVSTPIVHFSKLAGKSVLILVDNPIDCQGEQLMPQTKHPSHMYHVVIRKGRP